VQFWTSPLTGVDPVAARRDRLSLYVCWLVLAGWLWWSHVVWRDEVRAFSLALSGSNMLEMLRNVHGEGHPALWYLVLRGAHNMFPYREVLPVAGAAFGVAAMALITFRSPFRIVVLALVLFSMYGAYEYVAVARNYSMSMLVMFGIAALYPRIKNNLGFGLALAVLCNTNVPSCLLAAALLLFRFIELVTAEAGPERRDWWNFAGNAALALGGAILCFVTVYPTFNGEAVSSKSDQFGPAGLLAALVDRERGFAHLLLSWWVLGLVCLAFVRRPAALSAAISALLGLKLFFYFIYNSSYRHEALYIAFLLSLFWMTAAGAGGRWRERKWMPLAEATGAWSFVVLLVMQTIALSVPLRQRLDGIPFSHSAEVAKLLQRPDLAGAIVMADPDTMVEPLPYYVDNPLWLLRQQRFGKVVRLSPDARHTLTLDDILADAERLHGQSGRPVVFLSHVQLQTNKRARVRVMFNDATVVTPESVRRFRASTRQVASLRRGDFGDEDYDVYVYPR
jgi:hypothetical protein